ncbi:hypothetical protein PK69_13190 [Xanthomonas phaseoli pv. phaseoli]|uniref:Uncharacterized protein n=2 Tax=Xanthomonas TaxID=338 RepID=A0AB34QCQ7_XANCH|nr:MULTISPECIES: hypothetical protein [Xanthomonas]ATS23160.1 hypothetical protein XppCFBP412P_18395 [Xanthomonas phaseoli pv. phaseoli]ATS26056.1 hypothetical protein XppCFBP6164P_11330 [Xanthomonas phaseoli pv. phaseoli]ATS30452.1 hypothetical protein XppCFBP6546P_12355 [Xanthomonas phaseoli pv. phaseoli]ATS34315.1 hypothetical protein XppCFBP6982P_10795 [Xanthomonas phaseoli pv. phaseoli]AZU15322.1 hypothetical protein AC609_22230 [Xanthomonas phaseoli pv. phaseoli]
MMIDPLTIATSVVAKIQANATREPDQNLQAAAKTAALGMSPDAMEKWMMQIMMNDMSQQDDDAPDASPTLKADPDLF